MGKTNVIQVEGNSIDDEMRQQMYEIEKDAWAFELGEYTKCNNCGKIHSKDQVWNDLPGEFRHKTVSVLEREFGDKLNCHSCSGRTEYIFGESYKSEMQRRQNYEKYLLSTFVDRTNKILGFCDGYLGSFDDIYDNEFAQYYGNIGKDNIRQGIVDILPGVDLENLFCPAFLGIKPEYTSMNRIHNLILEFYRGVGVKYGKVDGVYESVLGSTLHAFYSVLGGKRTYVVDGDAIENTHSDVESDIFIHPDVTGKSLIRLDSSFKVFFRKYSHEMREIVEKPYK